MNRAAKNITMNLYWMANRRCFYENFRVAVSYRITCNNGNQRTLINP